MRTYATSSAMMAIDGASPVATTRAPTAKITHRVGLLSALILLGVAINPSFVW
jgi:hypothetical protein